MIPQETVYMPILFSLHLAKLPQSRMMQNHIIKINDQLATINGFFQKDNLHESHTSCCTTDNIMRCKLDSISWHAIWIYGSHTSGDESIDIFMMPYRQHNVFANKACHQSSYPTHYLLAKDPPSDNFGRTSTNF